MKLNKIVTLALVGITILATAQFLTAQGAFRNIDNTPLLGKVLTQNWTPEDVSETVITIETEWMTYKSFEELFGTADLVVKCMPTEQKVVYEVPSGALVPRISTETLVMIEEMYKGEASEKIIVTQSGGTYNGLRCVSDDESIIDLKNTMILYLKKAGDAYSIMGPQGMFIIENSRVYSIGEVDQKVSSWTTPFNLNGIELESFKASYLK
jgi:hypothetical protein